MRNDVRSIRCIDSLGFTELTKEKVESTESSEMEYDLDQESPATGEESPQDSVT